MPKLVKFDKQDIQGTKFPSTRSRINQSIVSL